MMTAIFTGSLQDLYRIFTVDIRVLPAQGPDANLPPLQPPVYIRFFPACPRFDPGSEDQQTKALPLGHHRCWKGIEVIDSRIAFRQSYLRKFWIDAGSIPTWGSELLANEIYIFFTLSSFTLYFCWNLNLILVGTGLTSRQRRTVPFLLNTSGIFNFPFWYSQNALDFFDCNFVCSGFPR